MYSCILADKHRFTCTRVGHGMDPSMDCVGLDRIGMCDNCDPV